MRKDRLALIIFLFFISGCAVDYSILEDRYCNSQNECIKGYKCDTTSGRCIKEGTAADAFTSDTLNKDIFSTDTSKDIYTDIHRDIYYYEDIEESQDIDIIEDTGNDIIFTDSYKDVISDGLLCESGTFICKNNDLYKCDENNQWVLDKSCEYGCKTDHCMECLPNEKLCQDEYTLKICNEEGIYTSEKCDYRCYNNQCVICLPEDKYCDGKMAIKCNPIGTEWLKQDCTIGCSAGECMICEPGVTKICRDNDVYICKASGMDFEKVINCCHDNNCVDGVCVKTGPRVIDYDPKDWKVGDTIYFHIYGCFFVKDQSKVLIDYGHSWKEVTEYSNFSYITREEDHIQIKVSTVRTDAEYNFKVQNPDGQESDRYLIKKHW